MLKVVTVFSHFKFKNNEILTDKSWNLAISWFDFYELITNSNFETLAILMHAETIFIFCTSFQTFKPSYTVLIA